MRRSQRNPRFALDSIESELSAGFTRTLLDAYLAAAKEDGRPVPVWALLLDTIGAEDGRGLRTAAEARRVSRLMIGDGWDEIDGVVTRDTFSPHNVRQVMREIARICRARDVKEAHDGDGQVVMSWVDFGKRLDEPTIVCNPAAGLISIGAPESLLQIDGLTFELVPLEDRSNGAGRPGARRAVLPRALPRVPFGAHRNPIPSLDLQKAARFAEMAAEMTAVADALTKRLGAALAQYATTRRACDQIRSMAPPGSALAFAATGRMARLPEAGAGLPPAIVSRFSEEFRRLSRAMTAAFDFNTSALKLVESHLRDARDCRTVLTLVGMIPGGPRLTLYMRAAERLAELGETV